MGTIETTQTNEENKMRAYIQYMNSYGEWQVTERMAADAAKVECAAMIAAGMEAFIRVCN